MSKHKLLLADDSITIQKVVNLTFADEGIEVISVGDGDTALQKINESAPDLIMADVNMPGLSGYEICEIIKQNQATKTIPVILLVGSFEPFDETEAQRVGADDFMTKPFQSIRQLVGKVSELLGRKNDGANDSNNASDANTESFSEPQNEPEFVNTLPDFHSRLAAAPKFSDDEMVHSAQIGETENETADFDSDYQIEVKDFELKTDNSFESYRTVSDFDAEKDEDYSAPSSFAAGNSYSSEAEQIADQDENANEKTDEQRPAVYDFADDAGDFEKTDDESKGESAGEKELTAPEADDFEQESAHEVAAPTANASYYDDFDLLELPPLESDKIEPSGSEADSKIEKSEPEIVSSEPEITAGEPETIVPSEPRNQLAEAVHTEISANTENAGNPAASGQYLSPEIIEAIAQRVVEKLSEKFFDKDV